MKEKNHSYILLNLSEILAIILIKLNLKVVCNSIAITIRKENPKPNIFYLIHLSFKRTPIVNAVGVSQLSLN